jgi:hypothetical protein
MIHASEWAVTSHRTEKFPTRYRQKRGYYNDWNYGNYRWHVVSSGDLVHRRSAGNVRRLALRPRLGMPPESDHYVVLEVGRNVPMNRTCIQQHEPHTGLATKIHLTCLNFPDSLVSGKIETILF